MASCLLLHYTKYNTKGARRQSQLSDVSRLKDALDLAKLGWSIVPLAPRDKYPLIKWRSLQKRRMSEREIIACFEETPDANIGVVTGKVSNLLVLDCDAPDVLRKRERGVPVTPIAETARGRHYYFRMPDIPVSSAKIAEGLDIKGDGGYVVAPHSIHPSGKVYEWVLTPFEAEPAPPPAWLLEMLEQRRRGDCRAGRPPILADFPLIIQGVQEGERNIASAKVIGSLLSIIPPQNWESIAWPLAKLWNQQNCPPLSECDLRRTFDSIAAKELGRVRSRARKNEELVAKILRVVFAKFSLRELAKLSGIPKSTLADLKKKINPQPPQTTPNIPPYSPLNPLVARTLRSQKPRSNLIF